MSSYIEIGEDFSGRTSARFEKPGDRYAGVVVDARKAQQTDYLTGQPKTWDNGDPIWQYVIVIETEQGDEVTVWCKGGNYVPVKGTGTSAMTAVDSAVREAGVKRLESGGQFEIVFSGLGQARGGLNPPKLYTAHYTPPPSGFEVGTPAATEAFDDEPF
jgi:hypothetical protein